ncbi:MAG TPA: hypothetical protein VGJ92_09725 [Methanocella sp.]
MKLITIVAIGAVMLVLAGTAAYVAGYVAGYYLDADAELPGMGLFAEKTINTSELYHTDQFSWFTYYETENHAVIGEPSYDKHITFDFSDAICNGSLSKHYRESITYFNRSGTNLTQYVDTYWDAAGITCINSHILVLENGSVTYSADLDHKGTGPWSQFIYVLPYGYRIAPRGEEKVTIGDRTYDCTKYFLPDHREGNTIEVLQHTLWFNDSIPVPVKIHIYSGVTLELAAWG